MKRLIKQVYFETLREKYHRGSKSTKGAILEQICSEVGCHRKHAIRLLRRASGIKRAIAKGVSKPKRGRKSKYDEPELFQTIRKLWRDTNWMGSKALKASIPAWLPYYETHYGELSVSTKEMLNEISPATIDRLLQNYKKSFGKGQCGTKPGTLLRNEIPIRAGIWDSEIPGFVEADTVAHCGNSLLGEFIWSLTLTDIATTWTEMRALCGKGSGGVLTQIKDIEEGLPFELLGFDCDNGSEFLNYHLLRYFGNKSVGKASAFQFTRSRPYHKGDNAHVEQKNYTHARQVLGYERLDFIELLNPINVLYSQELSLLRNHFYPSFKLKEKRLVNSRHRRIYDKPVTPYERVMTSPHVKDHDKEKLLVIHKSLDPFLLNKGLLKKQKEIQKLLEALKASRGKKVKVAK